MLCNRVGRTWSAWSVETIIASAIAVLGTPLGSGLTLAFQQRTTDKGHEFTRREKLRQERLDAYSAFADSADRGVDAGLDEVRGECERRVLTARVRMMNQPWSRGCSGAVAAPQGHVEGVEDELGPLGGGGGPAHDRPGEHVHDERDVDDPRPGGDIGEVSHPPLVWA